MRFYLKTLDAFRPAVHTNTLSVFIQKTHRYEDAL